MFSYYVYKYIVSISFVKSIYLSVNLSVYSRVKNIQPIVLEFNICNFCRILSFKTLRKSKQNFININESFLQSIEFYHTQLPQLYIMIGNDFKLSWWLHPFKMEAYNFDVTECNIFNNNKFCSHAFLHNNPKAIAPRYKYF